MPNVRLDGNVYDQNNVPVPGALNFIFDGQGLASLFDAMEQPIENPVVAGENGYWEAWVETDRVYTYKYFYGERLRRIDANIIAGDPPLDFNLDPNLRPDLATPDPGKGAGIVATEGGGPVADAAPLAISRSGGTDISARLAAAIATADGKPIVIPPGAWTAKNVDITGAHLQFTEGAVITMTLGAADNGFITSGGTTLIRPALVVENTDTPPDGGLGNAITMGTYETDGDKFNGLEIADGTFTSLNGTAEGLAISCLGRCQRVRLRGTTTIKGRFAGGFQAHWGGEFSGDPHSAEVTASYHPNDITIDTLVFDTEDGLGGYLGLSLSAAYNVSVGTIINRGWNRTDWIQPGDVYDLVAAPDQADKIMSGIRIGYTEVINPVQNSTGFNNVLVSGVSATIRTAGQTEVVCAADRKNMKVDHGEIRFVCEAGHTYDTNPLARMYYAKDSRMDVSFEGFASAVTTTLAQALYSTGCDVSVRGTGIARPFAARGGVNCLYNVEWDTLTAAGSISNTYRAVQIGGAAGTATVGSGATAGDTTIDISAWSDVSSQMAIKGTRIYLTDIAFVTLSRSQMIGTGVTTLHVDPVQFTISGSATLSVSGMELGSRITGNIVAAYYAVNLINVDDVEVAARCYRDAKYDVYGQGVANRRVLLSGIFDRCGQINNGSTLVNANMAETGSSTRAPYLRAIGAQFEQSGTPLVSSNVYARGVNNAVPGLLVTDCDLNSTSHNVNYLWPTDADVLNAGPPQVFGNRRLAAMANAGYEFDIGSGACALLGGVWHVTRTSQPGSGAWPAGSRWNNPAAASGVSPGSVRSNAGAWIALPNLS